MKKILKWVGLALVVAFLGIQLVRPARTNPAIDPTHTLHAALAVPADVEALLARACNDCHSSATRWPWYSEVAPASWLLAKHVREGRKELSFSEFATYTPRKQAHKLDEICELVEGGDMPMYSYTLLHRDAKLSTTDRVRLCEWAKLESARIGAGIGEQAEAAPAGK